VLGKVPRRRDSTFGRSLLWAGEAERRLWRAVVRG